MEMKEKRSRKASNKPVQKDSPEKVARKKIAESIKAGEGAVVFQLTGGKQRTHLIKSRCVAVINGRNTALRYVEGSQEIEVEKQGNMAGLVAKSIVMYDGKIIVTDEALKKYLRLNPRYGKDYVEYNAVKEAEAELAHSKKLIKAQYMAQEGIDDEKAYQVAKLLKCQNIDKLADSQIRMFLFAYAEQDPDKFLEIIESPDAEINDVLMNAFDRGFIEISADNKALMYTGGGKVLDLVNTNRASQIDFIIRWMITEKEGGEFLEAIRE